MIRYRSPLGVQTPRLSAQGMPGCTSNLLFAALRCCSTQLVRHAAWPCESPRSCTTTSCCRDVGWCQRVARSAKATLPAYGGGPWPSSGAPRAHPCPSARHACRPLAQTLPRLLAKPPLAPLRRLCSATKAPADWTRTPILPASAGGIDVRLRCSAKRTFQSPRNPDSQHVPSFLPCAAPMCDWSCSTRHKFRAKPYSPTGKTFSYLISAAASPRPLRKLLATPVRRLAACAFCFAPLSWALSCRLDSSHKAATRGLQSAFRSHLVTQI